ncbi:N-acetylgalactosamine-6-sulfatase [Persicitalea jodogahamensis]|uniref:N-acetylgalactosamine-6-sulfatase n=1 Tax=Persicitalea jodogahamensis TaxID=402147 RepID=A0A8J3DA78_9BACT|nr:N-acetylgalactosamine-6-sulfatase [Persicitalea jodogahamensis]
MIPEYPLINCHVKNWRKVIKRPLLSFFLVLAVSTITYAQQPNIIFVFADDWGFGDLGCYGNKEVSTPNLDKLATQGTRYTQFHVTSGVCSPSRSSVITGHFPARHRIHGHFAGNEVNARRGMPNWLDENLPVCLPREMQRAGYATAHFGKWHLGGGGLPHGDLSAPEPRQYGYDETRVWNGNGPTWNGDRLWPTTRYMDDDTVWIQNSSKIAVDVTIDFLNRRKGKAPLFVNLWLKDPHTPLAPTEAQRKPFKGLIPDKETYYAVLSDADYHVGRLMKALTEMGLDENTLVIFSSDNGPANYAPARIAGSTAGLKGRKTDVFDGGVKVPLIMRWPGHIPAGRVDSTTVLSTVDLLLTFCALAGRRLPADYQPDGESFAAIFSNKPFKRSKPLFWEWRFPYAGDDPYRQNSWVTSAIREGNWKLLADKDRKRIELYDISRDPFERQNLAGGNSKKAQQLLKKWDAWKGELPQ